MNRNKIRTPFAMKIFADVIAMLGLDEMEKQCQTADDYKRLQQVVIQKLG